MPELEPLLWPQVAALAGVAERQLGLWPISRCRSSSCGPRARAATMGRKPHQHVVFKEPPRPAKKRRTDGDGGDDPSKKYWFSTRDIAKFAANGSDARTKKKYELYELRKAGALPSKTLKWAPRPFDTSMPMAPRPPLEMLRKPKQFGRSLATMQTIFG